MRIHLFIIFFSLLHLDAFTQGFSQLKGNVSDEESGAPVVNTVISMQYGGFSSAVNDDGDFVFRFPTIAIDSEEVVFSAIGYKSYTVGLSKLNLSIENTIKLEKADPIVAKLGVSDARFLVQSAVDSLTVNNATSALLQHGFYSESVVLEHLGYVKIKNATLRVERFPEDEKLNDKTKSLRTRVLDWNGQSSKVKAWSFIDGPGIVCRAIETRLPVFLDKRSLKNYEYHVDSLMTSYDGLELYVVNFEPKSKSLRGGRVGKIYIVPSSRAIVRIEYELTNKALKEVIGKGSGSVRLRGESLKVASQYRWATDKWVLQENRLKVNLNYDERLDNNFNTNAIWNLRFIATESRNLSNTKINELELLVDTASFKSTRSLEDNWGSAYNYLPLSLKMREIEEHLR